MTPDARKARKDLILRLYRAGCTMKDISRYLLCSHGLVAGTVKEDPELSSRPRGRPRVDEPPPPTPRQILGDDYVPEFFTETQKTKFILKLPGQPLQHERTRKMARTQAKPRPDTVDQDRQIPLDREVGLSLSDDEPPAHRPSDTIRERIAAVAGRVDA